MIELLQEKQDLWEYLQKTEKPILMYGMGDGAVKIMTVFEKYGIKLTGMFASDEFCRGHEFMGYPVRSFSETKAMYKDFIIVLAFAVFREPLLTYIYSLQDEFEIYAPDVPVVVEENKTLVDDIFTLDYIKEYENEFDKVYSMLADEQSKRVFLDTLNFKVSGKLHYLQNITTPISEVYENLLHLGEDEVYVDLGAYIGDTIEEFLSYTNGNYKKIIAFEPDKKNFKKMIKMIEKNNLTNIDAHNIGSYDKEDTLFFAQKAGRNTALSTTEMQGVETPVNSVDNLIGEEHLSVLKLDVEGAEEKSIDGAKISIAKNTPSILLSAYHRNSDLYKLVLQIMCINPNYKIYLRHHPYVPSWETNFYLLKQEDF